MKKTLVILAHPNMESSRINKILTNTISGLENVTINDLYKSYGTNLSAIDIEKEQNMLLAHDRIVFQFPFYWYSVPAMLKEWQDKVLTYGFAFGSNGDKLASKEFKVVTTTGGADFSYQSGGWNNFSMSELLKPLQQTANLTQMVYTMAFVVHGVLFIKDEDLAQKALEYKQLLQDDDWGHGLTKYLKKMTEASVEL